MEKKNSDMTVKATVDVDIEKANKQVEELIGSLETASLLVNKLAEELVDLKLNIKI